MSEKDCLKLHEAKTEYILKLEATLEEKEEQNESLFNEGLRLAEVNERQKEQIATLEAAVKEGASRLARQQANDIQLLGERDEKIRKLQNALEEKENEVAELRHIHGQHEQQIVALKEELRMANLRSESLDRVVEMCTEEYVALKAERDKLREEKDALRDHLTFLDSLKQTEPEKGYDDLTSTLDKQQEFERGCLERLSLLTKQTEGGGEHESE